MFRTTESTPLTRNENSSVKTEVDPAFVMAVSEEAAKTFISGYDNNQAFIQQHDPQRNRCRYHGSYAAAKDARFTRHATWVRDTNYVAAVGPKSESDMEPFIRDTVFNPNLKHPITHVIALGHIVSQYVNHNKKEDFYNYITRPGGAVCQYGPFKVTIPDSRGLYHDYADRYVINTVDEIQSDLIIENCETGETRHLKVAMFGIEDGQSLALSCRYETVSGKTIVDELNDRKKILWNLFQQALQEPTLIHCSSGVGRTGHLILMFEILKHYHYIFENTDVKTAAERIHTVLNRIRENRPALVYAKEQLEQAICNADTLYRYAVEKKYDLTATAQLPAQSQSHFAAFFSRFKGVSHNTQSSVLSQISSRFSGS